MANLLEAEQNISTKGYLDLPVAPELDLIEEIQKLKKEKNAVLLAHYYQDPAIQDIADHIGDSLKLSQIAEKTDADMIVFAGVYFMGETAKILSPNKKVVIPDLNAGCSLVDSCPPAEFRKFLEQYPNHTVVTYINSTAEIKAMSDIVCTSSNAKAIIESIPEDQPIIVAPDKNLGNYLKNETGRDLVIWEGACTVHEVFSMEKIQKLKETHPEAKVLVHPECEKVVQMMADFIGSTGKILAYARESEAKEFIVVTEAGILHQMQKDMPEKTFIPGPSFAENTCSCSECAFMKMNTLEKLYLCMKYERPEVHIAPEMREKALAPIQRMLEISKTLTK
ncbi:quinolinate synthase NadA [Rapidithrix thailandica]|uniref:Quinolinate synthase n=1 Tax=Rapidithrix thailandica TaxID=413964 RepID=A0AAW9RVP2_9BACT